MQVQDRRASPFKLHDSRKPTRTRAWGTLALNNFLLPRLAAHSQSPRDTDSANLNSSQGLYLPIAPPGKPTRTRGQSFALNNCPLPSHRCNP